MAADTIPEPVANDQDPDVVFAQGKRNLLVNDYNAAVTSLGLACQLFASRHGDMSDELGEPYLHYGKALLYLAREEAGVLGLGVPGNEEEEAEEDEGDDSEDPDAKNAVEEKDDKETNQKMDTSNKDEPVQNNENSKNNPEPAVETNDSAGVSSAGSSKTDSSSVVNGEASTSGMNGYTEGEDEDGDDVSNDEEEGTNLQLAWEVLELAKLIILKRGPPGWKLLADVHRLLGEVAMESGNQVGALTDLNACLDLLQKIEKIDPRTIAETHYQLGLAYSLGNEFDSSIEEFTKATNLIEERIKDLEEGKVPTTDDPLYTIETEIKELKELLPDIREKISDMKDFKKEACKSVIEDIKKRASGSCTNGAGPSSAPDGPSSSATSELKAASDISHLVRKKRKSEEEVLENASPSKKPKPEKV